MDIPTIVKTVGQLIAGLFGRGGSATIGVGGSVQNSQIAGRDIINSLIEAPQPKEFWRAPTAPRFDPRPNLSIGDGQLQMDGYFTQVDGDGVKVEARWRGMGADTEFETPLDLLPPGSRKYRIRMVTVNPERESDDQIPAHNIAFELRFWWNGNERVYGWLWPTSRRANGKWQLDTTIANLRPAYHKTLD